MRRRLAALGILVVAIVGFVTAAPALAVGEPDSALGQQDVDADEVVLTADLLADGDARWAVEYRMQLANESERQAFADLRDDVEANTSLYTSRFRDRMNETVENAAGTTGREMAIENVTVAVERRSLPQEYGVVTYRFRWTSFAAVDGREIVAGDALTGFFLDDQTKLRVTWPSGYTVRSVTLSPDTLSEDARMAAWDGPREFGIDGPRIVVGPSTGDGPGLGQLLALAGVLVVLGGILLVALSRIRPGFDPLNLGSDRGTGDGDGAGSGASAGDDDGPPWELLSNDEQVLRLLERNGGRMKQQRIAGELDWTDAKTSQVIGDMREAGDVETFRLGRENVVTLPDRGLTEDGPGNAE